MTYKIYFVLAREFKVFTRDSSSVLILDHIRVIGIWIYILGLHQIIQQGSQGASKALFDLQDDSLKI